MPRNYCIHADHCESAATCISQITHGTLRPDCLIESDVLDRDEVEDSAQGKLFEEGE